MVKRRGYNLEARRQVRQKFWCAACFVSALFDIDGIEGICGRFGRIGVLSQHIGLLGWRGDLVPDDVGVSFTVLAGLFVRTALYMTETDLVPCDGVQDRCAKVRRQG